MRKTSGKRRLLAGLLLLACSGAEGARDGRFRADLVPKGCEAFVKERTAATKKFECQPAPQCSYLDSHPSTEVMLFLRVNKQKRIDPREGQISYSRDEAEQNRVCLAQYLNAVAIATNVKGGFVEYLQDVEAFGTFGRMLEVVAQLDSVWDVEVVCDDRAKCAPCAGFSPAECAANPLCAGIPGFRYDEPAMCFVPATVACLPFSSLCSDKAPLGVRDPQNTCWVLQQACTSMPLEGWRVDESCLRPKVVCSPRDGAAP